MRKNRFLLMITGTIFFAFLVAACSDTGPVRYADDEFWWVNYGIPTPEPTEAPGEVTTAVIKYYESYLQSVGLNLSVEKYLNLLGISLKDYVADEIKKSSGSLNVNDYRRERFCEVRDGMLFIAEKAEQLEKSRDYAKIELAGEQLTFRQFYEAGKPVEKPMGLDVTMPLSFQRQP